MIRIRRTVQIHINARTPTFFIYFSLHEMEVLFCLYRKKDIENFKVDINVRKGS